MGLVHAPSVVRRRLYARVCQGCRVRTRHRSVAAILYAPACPLPTRKQS